MIDAHLAAMAWWAVVIGAPAALAFVLGAAYGASKTDREWQERAKWMRKR